VKLIDREGNERGTKKYGCIIQTARSYLAKLLNRESPIERLVNTRGRGGQKSGVDNSTSKGTQKELISFSCQGSCYERDIKNYRGTAEIKGPGGVGDASNGKFISRHDGQGFGQGQTDVQTKRWYSTITKGSSLS